MEAQLFNLLIEQKTSVSLLALLARLSKFLPASSLPASALYCDKVMYYLDLEILKKKQFLDDKLWKKKSISSWQHYMGVLLQPNPSFFLLCESSLCHGQELYWTIPLMAHFSPFSSKAFSHRCSSVEHFPSWRFLDFLKSNPNHKLYTAAFHIFNLCTTLISSDFWSLMGLVENIPPQSPSSSSQPWTLTLLSFFITPVSWKIQCRCIFSFALHCEFYTMYIIRLYIRMYVIRLFKISPDRNQNISTGLCYLSELGSLFQIQVTVCKI